MKKLRGENKELLGNSPVIQFRFADHASHSNCLYGKSLVSLPDANRVVRESSIAQELYNAAVVSLNPSELARAFSFLKIHQPL